MKIRSIRSLLFCALLCCSTGSKAGLMDRLISLPGADFAEIAKCNAWEIAAVGALGLASVVCFHVWTRSSFSDDDSESYSTPTIKEGRGQIRFMAESFPNKPRSPKTSPVKPTQQEKTRAYSIFLSKVQNKYSDDELGTIRTKLADDICFEQAGETFNLDRFMQSFIQPLAFGCDIEAALFTLKNIYGREDTLCPRNHVLALVCLHINKGSMSEEHAETLIPLLDKFVGEHSFFTSKEVLRDFLNTTLTQLYPKIDCESLVDTLIPSDS